MKTTLLKIIKECTIKKTFFLFLALALAIGLLLTFSPGMLFVILLACICGFFVLRYIPKEEKRFVMHMFIIGLGLRILVSVVLDVTAFMCFQDAAMQRTEKQYVINYLDGEELVKERVRKFFKMGDSDYYSLRGYVYAAHVKGFKNAITQHYLSPEVDLKYGWSAYLYIIGLFYYLFDYSPVTVKFINCLIGTLGAVFIYKIGLNFSKKIARIALVLSIFFPSLVVWSASNLKEPTLILLNAIGIWATINFLGKKKIRYLAIVPLIIFVQFWISMANLWMILSASVLGSILVILALRKKAIVFTLFLFAFLFTLKVTGLPHFSIKSTIRDIYVTHVGHVNTSKQKGGIAYKVLQDKYYKKADLLYEMGAGEFAQSASRSLAHFFFEPFPQRMQNPYFLVISPQIFLWYLLVLFAGLGIIRGGTYGMAAYLPLLLFIVLGTTVVALASGNVGTLIRHRDMLTPFYLIFSAVGITCAFGLKD